MDGHTAASIVARIGVTDFLVRLRVALKDRSCRPLPAAELMIPKTGRQDAPVGDRDD